jgi:hypothetical protein
MTDQNGVLIISNIKGDNYSVAGFYKGFSAMKKIALPEGEKRLYELSLPVFMELLGVPFSFPAFLGLIIGTLILVITLAIIVIEYSRWRRLQLLKER